MTTTNWSGAVIQAVPGKSFSTVSAQWTVPTVSQVPIGGVTMTDVASWVGLDGYNSNDVAQAGIQETVTAGANGTTTVSYSAWDEWYPAYSNDISSAAFKVDPGDTVKITVETTGAGATKAAFLFDNETTGQTYQTSLIAPYGTSLLGNSAEFVVETPEWSNSSSTYQPLLSDFLGSPFVFQDASATYANGTPASLSGALTIGMETNDVPGVRGYTQEAYGSVSASADAVTVTEDPYWIATVKSPEPFHYPVVTLATSPSATNTSPATLGTATPGTSGDALSVALTSDADFTTGSTLVLNNGTLIYAPGMITAANAGTDTISYTVTDTVTGATTTETQQVTLSDGVFTPGPGTHTITGDGGIDTVVIALGLRQATLAMSGPNGTVTGAGIDDTLSGIDRISFIDGTMSYGNNTTEAEVARLYQAALGRAPDEAGLAYWDYNLNTGGSLTSLATSFLSSAEFAARFPAAASDNTAFVTQLYQNVLGRAPDSGGLSYWVGALTIGAMNRAGVLIGFSESAENQTNWASASAAGIWAPDPVAAEVGRIYDTAFARLPDASGLEFWKTAIESGQDTLEQVAGDFVASAEFQSKYGTLDNPNFVKALYENALHRAPDSGGLAYWANALATGTSRADVVLGFSESAEHIANTASAIMSSIPTQYGITFA